jgi:hypothetical protein
MCAVYVPLCLILLIHESFIYMKNERKIKNESDRNTTQCAEYSKRASYDTE